MVVKAVVFVFDGTIATLNLDHMTIKAEVKSHLTKMGIPASILSANESMFDMLKKAEIFLKNSGKSNRLMSKIRKEISELAEQHELEAAKTTSLLPGVAEVLATLKKTHLRIGLFTTHSEKTAEYILKRFGLSKLFDVVTPREKVKNVKPDPEHLETTLKALHIKPEAVMLISNDRQDVISGRELNVIVVGLPTELSSEKELTIAGVNYLISSISDVPRLIENINKSSRPKRETRKNKLED